MLPKYTSPLFVPWPPLSRPRFHPRPARLLSCVRSRLCMCVEKTLGRIEDHVRRCDQGLMLILAFGKNGTVGVIRSWGAIRAVHMTACLCVSPPLPSPLKTMPATACHSLSLFYFSSQAVFMPLSSSQPLLFLIFICFSVKECKDFFFFFISSMVKKEVHSHAGSSERLYSGTATLRAKW